MVIRAESRNRCEAPAHSQPVRRSAVQVLCARWLENPYYQFFCGELSFCHKLPFDRSSLTHWRQRLVEEAHKTGALAARDLERVVVNTTVQPKAIAHPTDARLCHRALEKLGLCGRLPARSPIVPRSCSGAIRMPTSSSGPGVRSSFCASGSAA